MKICETCKHIDPCLRMDAVGSGYCCYLCRMKKQTVKHSESCQNWESRDICEPCFKKMFKERNV